MSLPCPIVRQFERSVWQKCHIAQIFNLILAKFNGWTPYRKIVKAPSEAIKTAFLAGFAVYVALWFNNRSKKCSNPDLSPILNPSNGQISKE